MPRIIDVATEYEAEQLARRVLAGADRSLDWRHAGYASALEAARVLVGDGYGAAGERAAEIVAEELDAD